MQVQHFLEYFNERHCAFAFVGIRVHRYGGQRRNLLLTHRHKAGATFLFVFNDHAIGAAADQLVNARCAGNNEILV